MTKLLSANLLRLRKSMLFWGCLILMLLLGAGFTLQRYWEQIAYAEFGQLSYLDEVLFRHGLLIGIVTALFVPMFFGIEYSDGAIRNKMVVGHSRLSIYFANLITAAASSLAFCAAYILAVLALGVPLLNGVRLTAAQCALLMLGTLVLSAAFSALYTFVAMLCARKAASAVVCILGVFLLLFAGIYISARLSAPEFLTEYSIADDGQVVEEEPEPNPQYPRGLEREVYQFLYDFLPGCQSIQYGDMSVENPALLAAYSLIILTVSTGAGAALFRRKDLK